MLQVVYNRLDRRPEQDDFPQAERDRLGILARVPLASALLSGKYRAGAIFGSSEFRSTLGAERIERDLAETERIRTTEMPPGVPLAHWALAWCLKNPAVSAVIPGCKNPEQVRANAAAVELIRFVNAARELNNCAWFDAILELPPIASTPQPR